MRIATVAGAVVAGAALIAAGAAVDRRLLPREQAVAPPARTTVAKPAAPVANAATGAAVDLAQLRTLFDLLETAKRDEILGAPAQFQQFVHQENLTQSVVKAAAANKADQPPAMKQLMQRAAQRVLVESYLNQVVRLNLDPKFPSDAQIQEAYDKNPEAFRIPPRVHLWQIYIPLEANASADQSKAAWARADRIAGELRSAKGDFAQLARQYSAHEASRVNEGYMGLLKVSELLPPIAEATKKLKPGEVSEPIASESGLHVIKRGALVAGETLTLERVKDQLRQRMIQEAVLKVRQAAMDKIEKDYPVADPAAEQLESWRQALRKPPTASAPPPPAPERS